MAELTPLRLAEALPPLRSDMTARSAGPTGRLPGIWARGLGVLAAVALGTLVLASTGQRITLAAKALPAATDMSRTVATRTASPSRMAAATDLPRAN